DKIEHRRVGQSGIVRVPGRAAITRAVDAEVGADQDFGGRGGRVEYDGVDRNVGQPAGHGAADVGPGGATTRRAVGRLEHVAVESRGAKAGHRDEDVVRIGRIDCDVGYRAKGDRRLIDPLPGGATIRGHLDAAIAGSDVDDLPVRLGFGNDPDAAARVEVTC